MLDHVCWYYTSPVVERQKQSSYILPVSMYINMPSVRWVTTQEPWTVGHIVWLVQLSKAVLLSPYVQASCQSLPKCGLLSNDTCSVSPPQMAFKYLGIVLFPLFIGYGIYSLFYLEHKGWYSFVLSMMYGFLLTFGTYVCSWRWWNRKFFLNVTSCVHNKWTPSALGVYEWPPCLIQQQCGSVVLFI